VIALLEVFAACGTALFLGLIADYTDVGEYVARFLGLPNELEN
jgi:hypothetical protein